MRRGLRWLAHWWSRRRRDDDLDREIRTHLDLEAEEQREAGLAAAEARTAALRAFGNPVAIKETARDLRRRLWVDHLAQDVRFALRQILRAPGFTAAAALTLALGIGANTAVFSVINGYTRPLPVSDPDRIVVIASTRPDDETGIRFKFSFPAIQDYRARTTVFSDVFAFDLRLDGLGVDGKTSQFLHEAVTGNFFSALGLSPVAGRFFHSGESETLNAEPVLVLGHAFWERRFGADPAIIGSTVRLNGKPARIIGVAPKGFHGLMEGREADGYTPIGLEPLYVRKAGQFLTDRAICGLTMVARLRPDVTLAEAQAEVDVVARALADQYPETEKDTTARVMPEPLARPRPVPFLTNLLPLIQTLLLILTSMVLLIACMNVANLLLVRASGRQSEMAVRAALGAGRRRLVRLMLVESCALAALGAGLGLLLGKLVSVAFASSIDIGSDVPVQLHFEFDWRVFTFTLAIALATGLIVGVLPALRASRAEVTDLLHDGGRGGSAGAGRQRIRSILVVSQVAGSVALLVAAGLVVRSLREAQRVDLGFDPDQVLTLRLDTSHAGFDAARSRVFYDELLRRLQTWPGIESASTSFTVPLSYHIGGAAAHPEGQAGVKHDATSVGYNSVTPEYFRTLRIPILRGRGFTNQDDQGTTRVAVVNQTLAARFWPNQDPLGKRIEIPNAPGTPWEVVGVVRDSKYLAVFEWPLPHFYVPQAQDPSDLRALAVRSDVPFSDLGLRVRREIEALAPDLPIADLRSLREVVNSNFGFVLFRVGVWQATAMGLIGLILAIVGVYGVVSYRTMQRSREIGIRMALGAIPADVRVLVLRQGASLVVGGIVAGLIVTVALAGTLGGVLVSVSSFDPLTFVVVTCVVSLTALAACYIPARRAMRMDPASVLRRE